MDYRICAFTAVLFAQSLSSLPSNGAVVSGTASIIEMGCLMEISCSDQSMIDWDVFSIGESERVSFYLPSANDTVLNRVLGREVSSLFGQLQSNGKVILLNPQGIWIGADAKIDTASFAASTFDLFDQAKKKGGLLACDGSVNAPGGTIEFLGPRIQIGSKARIDVSSPVNGGSISMGLSPASDKLFISPGAQLLANGEERGGIIDLWSDTGTQVFGHLEARGGRGDGGLIEVSGGWLQFEGTVSTLSDLGKTGTFLLDPTDIRIVPGAVDMSVTGATPFEPNAAPNPSEISQATLTAALAGTNVVVQSSPITFMAIEAGNVIIHDDFTYASPNSLTLNANNSVQINCLLSNTGSGDIILQATGDILIGRNPGYPQTTPAEVVTTSGDILLNAGSSIFLRGGNAAGLYANVRSATGDITVVSDDVIRIEGGAPDDTFAQIGAPIVVGGSIDSDISVSSVRFIALRGGAGNASYAQIGHGTMSPSFVVVTGTFQGDIDFSSDEQVALLGGAGTDSYAQIGHRGGLIGVVLDCQGDVTGTIAGPLTLTGSSGDRSAAIVGHGTFTADGSTFTGDIDLAMSGPFTLTGGSGIDSAAQIGFRIDDQTLSTMPLLVNSNLVRVVSSSPLACTQNQGTADGSDASIGCYFETMSGGTAVVDQTFVQTQGNLTISANTPVVAASFIGVSARPTASGSADTALTIDVGGDLSLLSTGGDIDIDSSFAATPAVASTITIRATNLNLVVNAPSDSPAVGIFGSGDLSILVDQNLTMNRTSTGPGQIIVGSYNGVDIRAGNDITLYGNDTTGTTEIQARSQGNLYVQAGRDILLDGIGAGFPASAARIRSFAGAGTTADILAGRNIILQGNTSITATRLLNIVVDNSFPAPPLIGPGSLQVFPNSFIGSGLGPIRFFTARQNQNDIQGRIQLGASSVIGFTGGPLYGDVPPELWGVYYFDSFLYAGEIFTIFYKDSLQEAAQQANEIISEVFYSFDDEDRFQNCPLVLRDLWRFALIYDPKLFSSEVAMQPEYYWILHPNRRLVNLPYIGPDLDAEAKYQTPESRLFIEANTP